MLVKQKTRSKESSQVAAKKKVLLIMSVTVLVAAGIFAWVMYINDYYHATETALKATFGTATVEVVEEKEYYLFSKRQTASDAEKTGDSGKRGMIFYAGGKVDERAYAPLLVKFAEAGYEVYLVKMPARLAIFGANRAEDIIDRTTDVTEWTMVGHSLGGAMAASFAANHAKVVDHLVLLAAYSTKDLSDTNIEVYSFYGSEDKVLNWGNYQKYHDNLPDGVIETVIDGGNHANYAYYGEQEGDGKATITREEQQETVIDVFLSLELEGLYEGN